MTLETVTYVCGNCGARFTAPALDPCAYGTFLLRSPSGLLAHLDALSDAAYAEADAILARSPETAGLSPARRADVLRAIYGAVAVDPDPEGKPFGINTPPRCPDCGAHEVSWFNAPEPPQLVDVAVPPATHARWVALNEREKESRTRAAADAWLRSAQTGAIRNVSR